MSATRRLALLCAVLALAACQSDPESGEAACRDVGGTQVASRSGPVCAMPAPDAGKVCSGSSDCAGLCLAEGQCSPFKENFGCIDILEDGQPVTICID